MGLFQRFSEKLQAMFVLSGAVSRLMKLGLLAILVAHLLGGLWYIPSQALTAPIHYIITVPFDCDQVLCGKFV